MSRHHWLIAVTAAVLLGISVPSASAYVRTKAGSGKPLAWSSGCVFVSLAMEGTTDLQPALIAPVLQKTVKAWNDGIATCGYLKLNIDTAVTNTEVGLDGKNIIKFRQDKWCRPATKDTPEKCYAPQAAGITTVFYIDKAGDPKDGRILDADVELNAANFRFGVDGQTNDQTPGQTIADFQNTLTHELGHLIGLDHTCNDDTEHPTTDGNGNPVPGCNGSQLTPEMRDATMFAFQDDGETKKSTLEADDIAGACSAYPAASDPHSCEKVDVSNGGGCACSVATPTREGFGWLILSGAALTCWFCRRRLRRVS